MLAVRFALLVVNQDIVSYIYECFTNAAYVLSKYWHALNDSLTQMFVQLM